MYASQSKFVKHSACEKCGSRDNVAWYSNGTGFCFGCGAFYRDPARISTSSFRTNGPSGSSTNPTRSGNLLETKTCEESTDTYNIQLRPPPDDFGTYYPAVVVDWMAKYEITVTDMMKHNVKWSPSREQLLYFFYGEGSDLVLWQARNFRQGTDHKHRFFTGGTPETVVAAYYPEQGAGTTAVIVEDCASGIKCAKSGYTGIPVFGAKMSGSKMNRICKMFETVIWWLDSDKFVPSCKQSNLCKLLGAKSRVINTAYDPKEYSCIEMQELLEEF
jgi:hypothetical protein